MTHTGAGGAPPGPHRRRSIFRDESPDTELPDPWALDAEMSAPPAHESGAEPAREPVGEARPGWASRSIFRAATDHDDGIPR